MIRRPPRSTHCISSAASDVYKRQEKNGIREDKYAVTALPQNEITKYITEPTNIKNILKEMNGYHDIGFEEYENRSQDTIYRILFFYPRFKALTQQQQIRQPIGGDYMNFPGLKHKGDYCKYVECKDSFDMISLNKDKETLEEYTLLDKFIRACETRVRTSKEYAGFVDYIRNVIGLDFCQVSSNVLGTDATIEMHHNFFTLYDYVAIIINYLKDTGQPVNSFRVADLVIQEHYDLNVQVIMVAVTTHETIHNPCTLR
eukprot:TRINITY_DN21083_c0_g1_i1.p1 TRINITY_DN21083_c0_g1~~TRINITY_DN21083_c0_g1_i1.p1  ORF type:complete len:258 (+),score=26.55 TRINITY_DN21083_c0_g1_i1:120-893(+)